MTETTHRPAFDYEPNGEIMDAGIGFIRRQAKAKIEEADMHKMKCSMLPEITTLCRIISAKENRISTTKVYTAFVVVGMKTRYHEMKMDNPDAIHRLGEHIDGFTNSYNKDLINITSHGTILFEDAKQTTARFTTTAAGWVKRESGICGIRLADLNAYNVLAGVERFNETTPYYLPPDGKWIIDECLDVFDVTKRKLELKAAGLQGMMSHYTDGKQKHGQSTFK